MNTLIVGYYNHNNFGDDMFQSVFPGMLQNSTNINFVNIDKLHKIKPNDYNIIILGGGDVMSSYFLNKFHKWYYDKKVTSPCYAYSVGIPYLSAIDEGLLDIFDYIICRNREDTIRLQKRFGKKYIKYLPDFVFHHTIPTKLNFTQLNINHIKKPIVSIFLAKPCIKPDILYKLSQFINKLPRYQYIAYSLNTNKQNEKENDIAISNELQKLSPQLLVVEGDANYEQIISLIKRSYFTICTRFHSHVFSIMSHTPFISLFSTRKVRNLLDDFRLNELGVPLFIKCNYCCKIISPPVTGRQNVIDSYKNGCKSCLNMCGIPCDLSFDKLFNTYRKLIQNRNKLKHTLFRIHNNNVNVLDNNKNILPFHIKRLTSPFLLKEKTTQISKSIVKYVKKVLSISLENNITDILSNQLLENKIKINELSMNIINQSTVNKNISSNENKIIMSELVDLISYELTGTLRPDFYYGLMNQISESQFNLKDSLTYLIKYVNKNSFKNLDNIVINQKSKFNLFKITQEKLEKCHYSGWEYVINTLTKKLHNPNGVLFNGFIDRTFLWEYQFNKRMGIIPYIEPWTGFIHHAINNDYSKHSCVTLFERPLFIESLKYCQGIYVMSKYLQKWIINKLNDINLNIKVESLIHPTIIPELKFDYNKFINNKLKKILHIGGWYRNPYVFYELNVPDTFQKIALQGKNMNNYFKPDTFNFDDILNIDCNCKEIHEDINEINNNQYNGCGSSCNTQCNNGCNGLYRHNQYMKGMVTSLKEKHESVIIYNNLDNNKYDELLTENIVFLNLIDCSASNTVIECIVRNTPLLINPHPAIIELLGTDYPFYYNTLEEANTKINDILLIKETYTYLSLLPKDQYTIDYFLESIINSNIYKNIKL